MSRRYEFLDEQAEVLSGDALLELSEYFDDEIAETDDGTVALVIGNPWATAGVIVGTRDQLAGYLHRLARMVERS